MGFEMKGTGICGKARLRNNNIHQRASSMPSDFPHFSFNIICILEALSGIGRLSLG